MGAAAAGQDAEDTPAWPTSTPTSKTAACKPTWRSIALTAAGLGITPQAIDDTLYDAFGQRQVSTMYMPLNQYHVVMEVDAAVLAEPRRAHRHLYVRTTGGKQVPLSAFTHYQPPTPRRWPSITPGHFPSVTISFNLAPGVSLGEAVDAINDAQQRIGMPATHSAAAFKARRRRFRPRCATSRC